MVAMFQTTKARRSWQPSVTACMVTRADFQQASGKRRGAVLVVVMVCLLVVSLICAAVLKMSISEHRQVRMHEWKLQMEWLAESAIERAVAKLSADKDYTGETWKLSADEFGLETSGNVKISVRPVEAQRGQFIVSVQADYLRVGQSNARLSKQVIVAPDPSLLGEKP